MEVYQEMVELQDASRRRATHRQHRRWFAVGVVALATIVGVVAGTLSWVASA